MRLASMGDPGLLKAMGVGSIVIGCETTGEGIAALRSSVGDARRAELRVEAVMPEWGIVEKTIENPALLQNVMALLDVMSELGVSDLHASCGLRNLRGLSPAERRTYRTRYAEHLGKLYERAQQLGLRVCLHTSVMPGIYLEDVETVDRWLADFPMEANGLLLCVGCTESAGLDTIALIDRWFARIRAVHIRNVVGRFDDKTAKDVRLDSGTLRLPAVFEKLAAVGYRGVVMPEHFPEFPCENGRVASQAFSLGYCRALLQAAGRF